MATKRINFTVKALHALPTPAPGKVDYRFDSNKLAPAGFGLWITSGGAKTFMLYRKVDGRPERIRIGAFPDLTIEQARKIAGLHAGQIAAGKNPAEVRREKRAELTLGEMFELFLQRHAMPRGKRTVPAMRELFERYLGELPARERKPRGRARTKHPAGVNWQHRKLSGVKQADLIQLHGALGKAGRRTTANRVIELASALYNKAAEWKLFHGDNPAKGIEPYKETKRDRFIQADELPRFFEALSQEPSKEVRDFVLLSLLTGARRGNVLAMRWEDMSLERGEWRIPETKNGEPQLVPLMAEAVAILESRRPEQPLGFVFAAQSKAGHMANPKKGWRRILSRAGVTNLRIHDLRRSLGSWQAKTGASLAIIGKSLGHKTATATMIYARLDIDPVRDSMTRAAGAMLAAANVKGGAEILRFQKSKEA